MLVHIIDVDSGNIRSLGNAITHLGHEVDFVRTAEEAKAKLPTAKSVIFPGVGNFGHFMDQLKARGLVAPVREYIASGRPLMGICVGLQTLFDGSMESTTSEGLHVLSGTVARFGPGKSVPHIGWNTVHTEKPFYTIADGNKYYFVHSYARILPADLPGWEVAWCQYGDEKFVAAVAKGSMLFTQFHPEKSGEAGLAVIKAFIEQDKNAKSSSLPSNGLSSRVIACLDVRTNDKGDIVVTKGDQYDVREKSSEVRNLGKPVEVAQKYYAQGADEIVFLNITSFRDSPLADQPMLEVLRKASQSVFVPLTVGGGIRDLKDPQSGELVPALEVAHLYFRSGADKVSIGSEAVYAAEEYFANGKKGSGKSCIETISKAYGAQSVIVSIDPKKQYVKSPTDVPFATIKTAEKGPNGEEYCWYQCTVKGGREARQLGAVELAQASEALGAGELLLNCIDRDGSKRGFDFELINAVKNAVSVPVIASSGAGNPQHFVDVFKNTNADAALGAGMFHRNEHTVGEVKQAMQSAGIPVRL